MLYDYLVYHGNKLCSCRSSLCHIIQTGSEQLIQDIHCCRVNLLFFIFLLINFTRINILLDFYRVFRNIDIGEWVLLCYQVEKAAAKGPNIGLWREKLAFAVPQQLRRRIVQMASESGVLK